MMENWETPVLTDADREVLLSLVRQSIAARLVGDPMPVPPDDSPALQQPASVFVTLRDETGELRGCMGDLSGSRMLGEAVQHAGLNSAFGDPRFIPVMEEELPGLGIEISVLSPLQRIKRPEELKIGVHGLVIRAGGRAGLLLPQVATSRGWGKEEFLEAVCRKAGLPEHFWQRESALLYVFSAEIFADYEEDNS